MVKYKYPDMFPSRTWKWSDYFMSGIQPFLTLFLLIVFSTQAIYAQTPCNAHRWNAGDGWRFNSTTQKWDIVDISSPNVQPQGIIACASSAETETGLTAYKGAYNPSLFPINSTLTNCFNQETGARGITVSGPTSGEDIVWFNFDIRSLAGTYQFQIITNQVVGWALYYVDPAFAGPPTANTTTGTYPQSETGLSGFTGDCSTDLSHLKYADCGLSGNGWSTIKVPSFTKPSNYYLAMWIADPAVSSFPGSMNLNFKARYGCGGSTCTLESDGDPSLSCTTGGYQVCQTFNGSEGKWLIVDNATIKATSYTVTTYDQNGNVVNGPTTSTNLSTNPLYVELGTISGRTGQNDIKAIVCATYASGNPYDISLTPSGNPSDAPSDYIACTSSGRFSGTGLTGLSVSGTPTQPSCSGPLTGSIAIDDYDETKTYTLKKDGSVVTPTFSNGVWSGLAGGSYTITISGGSTDCSATSSAITISNAPNCGGHVFPTQTTCDTYKAGAAELSSVCYTASKGKVSNATPGVFFYYATITVPAGYNKQNLTLVIDQTACSGMKVFNILQGNQITAWTYSGCKKYATGSELKSGNGKNAVGTGDATITLPKVTTGEKYVISVKYDAKSLIGSGISSGTCVYTFVTTIGSTPVAGSDGSLLVQNCANSTITAPVTVLRSNVQQTENVSKISVSASPNPYTDKVRFVIKSPYSGKASLEVYNMLGQKLHTVFEGHVQAGVSQTIEYRVPDIYRSTLIYQFRQAGKVETGKLLRGSK